MEQPAITLTTDFGDASPYVAAMKGVILSVNPDARLVDLSHRIPPQDVRHAAFFLASSLTYFPAGTLHVVVVDPGVGTSRRLLLVEAGGQYILAPDNGCWTLAGARLGVLGVRHLTEQEFWRPTVSSTFHGRDVLAPVAGHLSRGVLPERVGPLVESWIEFEIEPASFTPSGIAGEVVFIDDFGNLLTNIPAGWLTELGNRRSEVRVGGHRVGRWARTYGEEQPGTVVAVVSSSDVLEIAVVEGNASRLLGVKVGSPVEVAVVEDIA